MNKQRATHTPGPWLIDDYGAGQRIVFKGRRGFMSQSFRIADAHFSSELADCARFPEMQANARLIAAAPEMLDALKAALVLIGHPDDAATKAIADVIARAEGDA